jgi:lipid-A-disaccharide synthase
MRIGMVAGELSGDILGAGLAQQLKHHFPDCVIEGIAGPKMQAAGVVSLYPMETLSVMGLLAVLKRLLAILKIRRGITQHFIKHPPDVFIGIDAPDFNLTVEKRLHSKGIKTVHYVSPSIWAWKPWRIHAIKKATDLVLCLLPFEVALYQKHQHAACFVGHPLADQIPMEPDGIVARQQLKLDPHAPCLALLPGSRRSEWHYLLKPFLETAVACQQHIDNLQVVLPIAHAKLKPLLAPHQALLTQLSIVLLDGQAQMAMRASDVVLLASGTATLEAMLLKKPMIVAYRLGWLSFIIARRMVKIRRFSLPNIIADKALVPECIQDQANVTHLTSLVLERLQHPETQETTIQQFYQLHEQLHQQADIKAAEAVIQLLNKKKSC